MVQKKTKVIMFLSLNMHNFGGKINHLIHNKIPKSGLHRSELLTFLNSSSRSRNSSKSSINSSSRSSSSISSSTQVCMSLAKFDDSSTPCATCSTQCCLSILLSASTQLYTDGACYDVSIGTQCLLEHSVYWNTVFIGKQCI